MEYLSMNIDDLMKILNGAKAAGAQIEVIDQPTPRMQQLMNQPGLVKRPSAEVQLMEIKQYLEHYNAPRFKVGDIVTPKKSSILRGSGQPFIVVEVNPNAERFYTDSSETSAPDFGARFNLRVCGYSDDGQHILCWWNESFHYDFWSPEVSGQA